MTRQTSTDFASISFERSDASPSTPKTYPTILEAMRRSMLAITAIILTSLARTGASFLRRMKNFDFLHKYVPASSGAKIAETIQAQ